MMKDEISRPQVDAQVDALTPRRLETGQDVLGVHHDVWVYRSLPAGMRRAVPSDLLPWTKVLYRVAAGPDRGSWYSCVVYSYNVAILKERAACGDVYVKKERR